MKRDIRLVRLRHRSALSPRLNRLVDASGEVLLDSSHNLTDSLAKHSKVAYGVGTLGGEIPVHETDADFAFLVRAGVVDESM